MKKIIGTLLEYIFEKQPFLAILIIFFITPLIFALCIEGLLNCFTLLQNLCGDVASYIKLKHCYLSEYCIPHKYMGKTYPAKTTKEIDYKIVNKFNGPVAVLNTKSKIIHYNLDCKYAKHCTKNCIYLPKKNANKLDINQKAYGCHYEENIHKLCSSICSDSQYLEETCIDTCVETKHNGKYFNLNEFIDTIDQEPDYIEYEDRWGITH